jgi:outer membrane protein assembly factor BamB
MYALDGATGEESWVQPVEAADISSTIVVGNRILVGSPGGVHALDRTTGRILQTYDIPGDMVVTFTASAATLVVIGTGKVYAIDLANGRLRWARDGTCAEGVYYGSPVILDKTLYCNGITTTLALDLDTGQSRWTYQLDHNTSTQPSVAAGRVYVSAGNMLHALDAASGRPRWKYTLGKAPFAPAVIYAKLAFIGTQDGHLYALET